MEDHSPASSASILKRIAAMEAALEAQKREHQLDRMKAAISAALEKVSVPLPYRFCAIDFSLFVPCA